MAEANARTSVGDRAMDAVRDEMAQAAQEAQKAAQEAQKASPAAEAMPKTWLTFKALLSVDDALALREFFEARGIEFEAV